ncbi:hypothetical protein [Mycobacteroides abscessus]|uniref:hypothetical protein n=1 Tax=Mycobacteroides abscessus TaxID=36809 RepID=UPI0003616B87|nr:hypothetical protein [Mycobacteroides abscessus]
MTLRIKEVNYVEVEDGPTYDKVAYVEILDSGVLKLAALVGRGGTYYHEVTYLPPGRWKCVSEKVYTLKIKRQDVVVKVVPGLSNDELYTFVKNVLLDDGATEQDARRCTDLVFQGHRGELGDSNYVFEILT